MTRPKGSSGKQKHHLHVVAQDDTKELGPEHDRIDTWSGGVWGLVLAVALPENVDRHPRVLEGLRTQLERPCVLDDEDEGVRVSLGLVGTTIEEAKDDAREMTTTILGILGFGPEAVLQQVIVERGKIATE